MTNAAQTAPRIEHLLTRSQNWLKSNPALDDVKRALGAIVHKVRTGEIVRTDDTGETADALTEYYVDHGGDLTTLPTLDEPAKPPIATPVKAIPDAEPDYGLLYPDVPAGKPLSREEKQAAISNLKTILRRPEGM